jgi:general L-amino acid transport system substrate-binding protein
MNIALLAGIWVVAADLAVTGVARACDAQTNKTLTIVKQRGALSCGVNGSIPGFSISDDAGHWTGFDVDYCRAIAVAIFGDATKVKFVPTTATQRFNALQSGEVDVLVRNTTWTSARDSVDALSFTGVNYYDGQGFMVKTSLGAKSAKDLHNPTVCVESGTTSELNLASYFKASGTSYKLLVSPKRDLAVQAYLAGRCDVYTTDMSGLYSVRVQQARPRDHFILPDVISKEPLGPSVRQGDSQWFTIVKWVHFALLSAEELGVTQANVDQMVGSSDPNIRLLLGSEGEFGNGLGLNSDFVAPVIRAVGNYGEIFERNVGSDSRLKIARGLNNLWNKGGLQYAPPVR